MWIPCLWGLQVVASLLAVGVLAADVLSLVRVRTVVADDPQFEGALVEVVDLQSVGFQVVGNLLAVGVLVAVLDLQAETVLQSEGAFG